MNKKSRMNFFRIFILGIFLFFSFCLVSAVPEGYSCGYMPDSSPYCDSGLSCDYFQCVYDSNQVPCSSLGGEVCYNTEECNGHWLDPELSIENWCCSGSCYIEFAGEGDWCARDSDCEYGLDCVLYRCQSPGSEDCRDYSQFCSMDSDCCSKLECENGRCVAPHKYFKVSKQECEEIGMTWCPNDEVCAESYLDCPSYSYGDDSDSCGCWIPKFTIEFEGIKPVFRVTGCLVPNLFCKIGNFFSGLWNTIVGFFMSLRVWIIIIVLIILLWVLTPYVKILQRLFRR